MYPSPLGAGTLEQVIICPAILIHKVNWFIGGFANKVSLSMMVRGQRALIFITARLTSTSCDNRQHLDQLLAVDPLDSGVGKRPRSGRFSPCTCFPGGNCFFLRFCFYHSDNVDLLRLDFAFVLLPG